jgi:hypothetical protein
VKGRNKSDMGHQRMKTTDQATIAPLVDCFGARGAKVSDDSIQRRTMQTAVRLIRRDFLRAKGELRRQQNNSLALLPLKLTP